MTKKFLSLFAILAVAVLVGAAGCQKQAQNSADTNADQSAVTGDTSTVADDATTQDGQEQDSDGTTIVTEGDVDVSIDAGDVMESADVKEFTVEGGMFYFSPKEMTVNQGDKVKITFKNIAGVHDWVLDEFNAKTPQIKADETATVEFTADKAGTFEYYCSVGNHRQQGMVGTLTVNAAK